jgi:ATP-dependent RNA helicase DeaD
MKNINFKELNLSNDMQRALDEMGFVEATPIQTKSIPEVMEGKDVTGLAQTGTGKTYAFGIPAIENLDTKSKDVQVLVLCPTRELAMQTAEGLQQLAKYKENVKIVSVYGGQPIDRQIMAIKKRPQIIVGTPGRVMDHLKRKTLNLENISMFVLDEADEMLNMGFREDIDTILKKAPAEKQIVLFSATMSKGIMDITSKYQKKDAVVIKVASNKLSAPKIRQCYLKVAEATKDEAVVRIFESMNTKLGIIFCNTKLKVDEVTSYLQERGYKVEALHGDIKQSQRDVVMRKFRNDKINILVATDVAARGIDVDDIEIVINYNIPIDDEYYVHRIGRTGRAGKEGMSITFVNARQMNKIKNLERYTNSKLEEYTIPSAKELNEKRLEDILAKITREIGANDLTEEIEILNKYTESTDIPMIKIAAVLLKLKFDKTKVKELKISDKLNMDSRRDRVRLFMTLGKKDNLKRSELKDYITEKSDVSKNDIYDVEVLDKFSFITIKESAATKVIKALNNTKYNGRKIAIEVSSGKKNR